VTVDPHDVLLAVADLVRRTTGTAPTLGGEDVERALAAAAELIDCLGATGAKSERPTADFEEDGR
jgi:hypothetical protein